MKSLDNLKKTAASFSITGVPSSISELGEGNVNDTFLVETNGNSKKKYVLQRINQHIFKKPDQVAVNIVNLTNHLNHKEKKAFGLTTSRWVTPTLINCSNGEYLYRESADSIWRMTTFIENSKTYQQVNSPQLANETGKALGTFHNLLSDMDKQQLHNTLPGFHQSPRYLIEYNLALSNTHRYINSADFKHCSRFIENRKKIVDVLEDAKKRGLITEFVTHGDPKINNILFDDKNDRAIGMIDLDTVKPGLLHHDIGDCLRSSCNPAGEETQNLNQVEFNLEFAKELIEGYLESAGSLLTLKDKSLLFDSVLLLAFELGLRFFTDHLNGDVYFKTKYENQNLNRAKVQFKLVEDIERKEKQIRAFVSP